MCSTATRSLHFVFNSMRYMLKDEGLSGESIDFPGSSFEEKWIFHDFPWFSAFRLFVDQRKNCPGALWIRFRRWSLSSRPRGNWVGIQPVKRLIYQCRTNPWTLRLGKCEKRECQLRGVAELWFWLQFAIGICGPSIGFRIAKGDMNWDWAGGSKCPR